jgi:VanZ family protein
MLQLCALFAALLLAGSLFPWDLHSGPGLGAAVVHLLTGWDEALGRSSRRDIVVNLAIYVPIGFTLYLWRGWRSRTAQWALSIAAGAVLSFTIETLQAYFPPRMPSLPDVLLNTLSSAAGAIAASVFHALLDARHADWRRHYSVQFSSALLLLGLWVGKSSWPYYAYPLLIGARVRALLRPGEWTVSESVDGALPWLLAGCLLMAIGGARAVRWLLPPLLPALLLVMLISPGHGFTWSHAAGAAAAVLALSAWPVRSRTLARCLTGPWLLSIGAKALSPYLWLDETLPFGWIPFRDLLDSKWMPGIATLLSKTWLYGAAFWLLSHSVPKLGRPWILLAVAGFVAVLEFVQLWIPTRSPGLTDPAIALLAGALLWTVDRRFHAAKPLP